MIPAKGAVYVCVTPEMTYESLLLAILGKVQDIAPALRSRAAQDAYVACAFLRACADSRLRYYLGTQSGNRLQAARKALLAIGVRSASDIIAKRPIPMRPSARAALQAQARQLEDAVAGARDAIFAELTRYAAFGCMADPDFFRRV